MRDDLYTVEEEAFVESFFDFNGIDDYDDSEDDRRKEALERFTETE